MSTDLPARLNAALQDRYSIERELGQGGMATVYLAQDVRHDRKVALKVLKPELAAVIGAERFLAEIKTTANLQHPHILPLFDSGEADGFLFYVMPFVRGESLRDRIDREKQLGVEESVAITRKVADALDYAHGLGVVHRDIKPANVLLSERGEPLVADFGIALAVAQAGGGRITETGLSLGTPHYMSPEQATGDREVDPRSDVYALGCVLYEMLAGQPPFAAPTAQAVLVRVLTTDVTPVTSLRRTVPPHVESVLAKALEKLPADRFSSAAEFSEALEDEGFAYRPQPLTGTKASSNVNTLPTDPRPWLREPRSQASLGVILVLAVVAVAGWWRPAPSPAPVHATRSLVEMGDIEVGIREEIAVSPDGSRFAVIGTVEGENGVYWRDAAEERFRPIPGTEDAREGVSFSPDGNWLVYATASPDALMKVSLSGGAPIPVVSASLGLSPRLPHWGDDGTIAFTGPSGLHRVDDTGGEPVPVLGGISGSLGYLSPRILPGGRGLLGGRSGGGVMLVDAVTGTARELIPQGVDPQYVETGHLIYADAFGGLWAAPFDLDNLELTGGSVPLFEGVSVVNFGPADVARYDISRNGTLVYGSGLSDGGSREVSLLVMDLDGNETRIPLDPRTFSAPRWSPDGEFLAYASLAENEGRSDIFTYDVERRTAPSRLTVEGDNTNPVWSPDGSRVAFTSTRDGTDGSDLYMKTALDDAPPELLVSLPGPQWPTQWPSENVIVFEHGSGNQDLWILDVSTNPVQARPYYEAETDLDDIQVSHDGGLAAYTSEETGREEIYVSSFPDPRQPTAVSQGLGDLPLWAPDDRTLYYQVSRGATKALVAARIERGPPLVVTSHDTLFSSTYVPLSLDLHPDGDRFIAARAGSADPRAGVGEPERFVVVVNWFEELRERMGEGN